jgi:hypothetical protein
VICVRTLAGGTAGIALLSLLLGCTPYDSGSAPAPTISIPSTETTGSGQQRTSAPADNLFGGSAPVSIVDWWNEHPDLAPADLAERTLLLNRSGTGPRRFPGADVRKYATVQIIITCSSAVAYTVRLQVLDGLSIDSTSGDSCGGPALSTHESPPLNVVDANTEVEVQVPAEAQYYVTIYGISPD